MFEFVILDLAFYSFVVRIVTRIGFIIYAKCSPEAQNIVGEERWHELVSMTLEIPPVLFDNFVQDLFVRYLPRRQRLSSVSSKRAVRVLLASSSGLPSVFNRS